MKTVKVLFLLILLVGLGLPGFSQSSAELKRKKAALTREINLLNKSLNRTSANKQLSLKQINAITTKIRLREEKINTINSEIKVLESNINQNVRSVRSLQANLNDLRRKYAAMIQFAYKNRNAYTKLMFIFGARDFNQAYKRLKYLQQFAQYREKQAEYIDGTQRQLTSKIAVLNQNKNSKSELLEDQEKEKEVLGKEKQYQAVVVTQLSKKEQTLKSQLTKKQKEAARLNRAIQYAINREIEAARKAAAAAAARAKARAAAAARAKSSSPSTKTGRSPSIPARPRSSSEVLTATPEAAKLSSSFAANRGRLPWPVSGGAIVEGFGRHKNGVNVIVENNGVDIRTSPGANVKAVFSGTVSTVANMGNMYVVLIRHGEYFSVYSNLRSASVSRGQKVSTGQSLGSVYTDPVDNIPQLHFEIRKGAAPLNPSSWLAR